VGVAERTLPLPAVATAIPPPEVAAEVEVTPILRREAVEAVAVATARVRTEDTKTLLKETGAAGRNLNSTRHCPCPPYWHGLRVGVKTPHYARA
jgi:hypothetical protein